MKKKELFKYAFRRSYEVPKTNVFSVEAEQCLASSNGIDAGGTGSDLPWAPNETEDFM